MSVTSAHYLRRATWNGTCARHLYGAAPGFMPGIVHFVWEQLATGSQLDGTEGDAVTALVLHPWRNTERWRM